MAKLRADERLSYLSAARQYGVPLPWDADARIHITGSIDVGRARVGGIVGHRDRHPAVLVQGAPVSTPEQTFLELAEVLSSDDLVAAGDFLIHAPRRPEPGRPWTTLERLREAAAVRRRGVRRARSALELVRIGVESPQETQLRLLLVRNGIPEPKCGYRLRAVDGSWIGWFDLAWPERGVLGEYDGDQHRTSAAQYEKDIRRFDLAADNGARVIRVRAAGLRAAGRAETVTRFRSALGL